MLKEEDVRHRPGMAFIAGAPIGALGGLIGLGGAEFRLPVLKAVFRYPVHRAVALNLATSFLTLVAALLIRVWVTDTSGLVASIPVVLGIIAGALTGAWLGASYASRISAHQLERLILVLLVALGVGLIVEAFIPRESPGIPGGWPVWLPLAVLLGVGIGMVSSLLGVAGGELIIPTLVFVFGVDVILAGTASVIISLPTVSTGLLRYTRRGAFTDRTDLRSLVLPMGMGSILGTFIGGVLVPYVPSDAIKFLLGVILIISAVRIFGARTSHGR